MFRYSLLIEQNFGKGFHTIPFRLKYCDNVAFSMSFFYILWESVGKKNTKQFIHCTACTTSGEINGLTAFVFFFFFFF